MAAYRSRSAGTNGRKVTSGRVTPASRSARASAEVATPYPQGPSASSARATGTAPSP